jgi:hypothetical protein
MNKAELIGYLEKLDNALKKQAVLYVYGSAVGIILDQPERTSLDIDIAAPYSDVVYGDLVQAADKAGIPVNPPEEYSSNHIEWVQVLRLCLPKPSPENEMTLWQGEKLIIKSGSVGDLIASKLIRYDEIDQGDIQFLMKQSNIEFSEIQEAVKRLPDTFARDALVKENLINLRIDMKFWRGDEV